MTPTLSTCPRCHCAYVANGRAKFCVACGTELVNRRELAGGFGRKELDEYIHNGWSVFVAKMEND